MSDGRRLRVRDQGSVKGPKRTPKKGRPRMGSISVSNEDSSDGDDDTVTCARKSVGRKSAPAKDTDKGLRSFRRKSKARTSLAERDVIDGFLILSFATYQDLEVSSLHARISVKCFILLLIYTLSLMVIIILESNT